VSKKVKTFTEFILEKSENSYLLSTEVENSKSILTQTDKNKYKIEIYSHSGKIEKEKKFKDVEKALNYLKKHSTIYDPRYFISQDGEKHALDTNTGDLYTSNYKGQYAGNIYDEEDEENDNNK
jgi:hypothetical protein